MPHLKTARHIVFTALATTMLLVAGMSCAYAQQNNFVELNGNFYGQLTAVPYFFKQITVVVSLVMAVTGIHGIYKGGADPRAAAPLKNIFLIVISGLMLAISSVALIAEKSTFGTNDTGLRVSGSATIDDNVTRFRAY